MIDITKFFIIKQDMFDEIIIYLNANLTREDHNYVLTYIVANIFGYLCILFTIWIVLWFVNKLSKPSKLISYWR